MSGLKEFLKKELGLGDMAFNASGGAIKYFPSYMAAARRAIRRLKLSDLVIEINRVNIPNCCKTQHGPVRQVKRDHGRK
ncbi:hypothetical protein VIGAN_06084300 [Vigna angularis var. angularis]|uniref:Uncharacterized protein n=1 Tax=Vigna angularis var. angularis TaxID=157739 RepID=A0A0S3SAG1_PHAAN|nr:hypothetical protein VIGAN_06084300 [Vigna angularis var. angularis]